MDPISKPTIQRALVNVTKSERAAVSVPTEFDDVDWAGLDFYGWRDPKFPRRGYLVCQEGNSTIAIAVSTTGPGLTPGRKAMCAICRAVGKSSDVALFTAKRTGPAGRAGNTVGTYICADLDCSAQLRNPGTDVGRAHLGTGRDIEATAAEMLTRLSAFFDAVHAS